MVRLVVLTCMCSDVFQAMVLDFAKTLLLVDPAPFFGHQFRMLSTLSLTSSARGATRIVELLRELAIVPAYTQRICEPPVIQDLIDLVAIATDRQPPDSGFTNRWTDVLLGVLDTLGAFYMAHPPCGEGVYNGAMEVLLYLLHDPRVQEPVGDLLVTVSESVAKPTTLLEGLVHIFKMVEKDPTVTGTSSATEHTGLAGPDEESTSSQPTTATSAYETEIRKANDIDYAVVHRSWEDYQRELKQYKSPDAKDKTGDRRALQDIAPSVVDNEQSEPSPIVEECFSERMSFSAVHL